jgi:hypothetical protein
MEVAGTDGKMVRSHFAIGAEGHATIAPTPEACGQAKAKECGGASSTN